MKIHFRQNGDQLCAACYCLKRVPRHNCSGCGKILRIIANGLCHDCYLKSRPKKICSRCGKRGFAVLGGPNPVCYKCYHSAYNKLSSTIARKQKYSALRRSACENGSFSGEEWLTAMRIAEWKCLYCLTELTPQNRTMDHVIPLSQGGIHNKYNMVPCCGSCNSRKNGRALEEWCGRNHRRLADLRNKISVFHEQLRKFGG